MKPAPRRKARILALQILHSRDHLGPDPLGEKILALNEKVSPELAEFASTLAERAWDNLAMVDVQIQKFLTGWKQSRLSKSLNALMRLSVAELLYFPEQDAKVVINEALEICKSHVDPKATSILNGVLHGLAQSQNSLPS